MSVCHTCSHLLTSNSSPSQITCFVTVAQPARGARRRGVQYFKLQASS